jgi:hypothetical protein
MLLRPILNHMRYSRGAAKDISPWRKPWENDKVYS